MNNQTLKRSLRYGLGILLSAFMLSAVAFIPTPVAQTKAATVTNTYVKAYKMNRVSRGTSYFYNYNPNSATEFDSNYAYIQANGGVFATAAHDVAYVWTAPADGKVLATNASGGSAITVQTNREKESLGSTQLSFWKGKIGENGMLAIQETLTDTDEGSLFKTVQSPETPEDITRTNISVPKTAMDFKSGESFIFVVKAPSQKDKFVGSNQCNITFTPNGGTEQKYIINISNIVKETKNDTADYTAETNLVSFYSLDTNYFQLAPTEEAKSSEEFNVIDRAEYKVTAEYAMHPETGNGQFVNNYEVNSNWDIVVNGSKAKIIARSGRDSSVFWKAEKDCTVTIDRALFTHAGGAELEVAVLIKDANGKFRAISAGTNGRNTVNATTSYSLPKVGIKMKAGEEIFFTAYRVEGDGQTNLDIALQVVAGEDVTTYNLNGASSAVTAQGQHGFYYGKIYEHKFGTWVDEIPANCQTEGTKGYYFCSTCQKYFDENYVEIADISLGYGGHEYTEWIEEVPANCQTEGTKGHYGCNNCDKKFDAEKNVIENIVITDGEHDYTEWVEDVPANCQTEGTKGHYGCNNCDKKFDAEKNEIEDIAITDGEHVYSEWINEVAAKCDKEGVKGHYECTACKKNFDKNKNELSSLKIKKIPHTIVTDAAVEPTKDESGLTEGRHCSECGEVIVAQEEVPALGGCGSSISVSVGAIMIASLSVVFALTARKKDEE